MSTLTSPGVLEIFLNGCCVQDWPTVGCSVLFDAG
jgi:hypothetical protein